MQQVDTGNWTDSQHLLSVLEVRKSERCELRVDACWNGNYWYLLQHLWLRYWKRTRRVRSCSSCGSRTFKSKNAAELIFANYESKHAQHGYQPVKYRALVHNLASQPFNRQSELTLALHCQLVYYHFWTTWMHGYSPWWSFPWNYPWHSGLFGYFDRRIETETAILTLLRCLVCAVDLPSLHLQQRHFPPL